MIRKRGMNDKWMNSTLDSEIFSVRVSNIGSDSTAVGVSIRWREIY
jgi:hypothetical protein